MSRSKPMEYGLLDRPTSFEVLHDDPLEQLGRHTGIPHAFWIQHDNGSAGANAEARCLAALHTRRTEQQVLPLEQARQQRIETAPSPIR